MTTNEEPTERSSRPHRRIRGLVLGFLGAAVLTLVAMFAFGTFGDSRPDDREITIDDDHIAIELTVPEDLAIDDIAARPTDDPASGCPTIRYEFGTELVIEAYAADCEPEPQPVQNGYHGAYRTLADVPDATDTREIATDLGGAQVFLQRYAEYTNERNAWEEPVAIVTLDAPTDQDFPTLVLRSNKAELSREEFTTIVKSLSPIE